MATPSSFISRPVDMDRMPVPTPPRYVKKQIYSDTRVFEPIDTHAINEARTNYRNFRDLIYNLIYKKNFNDLEKARAIFRWMTTKNMFTIMFDSELPGSPEQIISGFKDGKTTYARIFECLAQYAGLYCTTISGWAKGVDYRPGNPICSTPVNHSWNAVQIDGNWQLVDSHWATRYLQSERNTPDNLVYEYDDFYFIPDPGHLIYSHCPEDSSWELLYPVRARAEFEDYPLVKSFFFNIGMQFLQQNTGIIYTKRGLITVTLGFTKPTSFTFKLTTGDQLSEVVSGIALKRYVIQETTENRVTFYFRSPREGNYFLTVFAQQVGDRIKVENVFKAACEYKIICDQAAGDIKPYPLVSDSNWGPGAPVKQYGLTPSHKTAILAAPNGRTEVSFAKSRDVRLYARLTKDGMDEDTLERAVTVREQDNVIYVTVQLPARGEYGLEVYANEPQREGDTFTHMCQYLTSFTDRDFGTLYGQVFDRTDLTSSMQATPLLYTAQGELFANQSGDSQRFGPGGKMAPQQMRPGQTVAPGGKQTYQTSSADWDGNTYTEKSYKEQSESSDSGNRSYRQQTTQEHQEYRPRTDLEEMTTRMETVSIGGVPGKKGPDTAPKRGVAGYPGQRGPGQGEDDLPPPPPELMDQSYQQQHRAPEQPGKPPVEIVYVPATGRSPQTLRRTQEAGVNEKDKPKDQNPVEIVFVEGGKDSGFPGTLRRKQLEEERKKREEEEKRKEEEKKDLEKKDRKSVV